MRWGEFDYNEKEVKLLAVTTLATSMYREANNKEFLYGNFTSQNEPYEPLLYDGEELTWVRDWTKQLIILALDECVGRIEDELASGLATVRNYGIRAHHIWPSASGGYVSTGVWGVRQGTIQKMIGAIRYRPVGKPCEWFDLDMGDGKEARILIREINTTKYSRGYNIHIEKEQREYNEDFWASESYDTYYWNIVMGKDVNYVAYPFHTVAEQRIKDGKDIRIEV